MEKPSWLSEHRRSADLAGRAHLAKMEGRTEAARLLYFEAGKVEAGALLLLDWHVKARTFGIAAVSVVALLYKAGRPQLARDFGATYLKVQSLPKPARVQIEEMLAEGGPTCAPCSC